MAVSEAAGELSDELGATPTVSQIAERLDWEEDEVSEALQAERGASHPVARRASKPG